MSPMVFGFARLPGYRAIIAGIAATTVATVLTATVMTVTTSTEEL
jgi:hypothetical protein